MVGILIFRFVRLEASSGRRAHRLAKLLLRFNKSKWPSHAPRKRVSALHPGHLLRLGQLGIAAAPGTRATLRRGHCSHRERGAKRQQL